MAKNKEKGGKLVFYIFHVCFLRLYSALSALFFFCAAPCQSLSAFATGYPAAAKQTAQTHTHTQTHMGLQPELYSTPALLPLLLTLFSLIAHAQSQSQLKDDNYGHRHNYNYAHNYYYN